MNYAQNYYKPFVCECVVSVDHPDFSCFTKVSRGREPYERARKYGKVEA